MNESVEQIGITKPSIARNNGLITLPSGRVSEAGEGAESKVEKRREARPPRERVIEPSLNGIGPNQEGDGLNGS